MASRRNSTDRLIKRLITLAVVAILSAVGYFSSPARYQDTEGSVARVIDGDTLEMTDGSKVRLIGIDCPETHEGDKLYYDAVRTGRDVKTIKAMGQKAFEFTNSRANGQKVRLSFDSQKKDKYGRLLAYVYLPFPELPSLSGDNLPAGGYIVQIDGKKWYFLNATIIQQGYAVPMSIPPNVKYAETFKTLYTDARRSERGLWAEASKKPIRKRRSAKPAASGS